ncbi:MAG: O-methyltransferase [Lachnospiraceae bacterium]|jgi:predicted O-methyltransferase YrrM|nr:O-methyltransferase [Lachnospiraceae bacterium]
MNKTLLNEIKKDALERHIPIIMDDTLEEINKIIKQIKPTNILEIGTAVGYSSICFTEFMSDAGKIDTIEIDEEKVVEAKENIKKMGLENKINVIAGDAVLVLPEINEKYDMIFIDASKGKYPTFLKEALRLSKKGTIILADNILYKGYVLGDYNKHKQRTAVNRLREYVKEITENEKLDTQILEVGDGLGITKVC